MRKMNATDTWHFSNALTASKTLWQDSRSDNLPRTGRQGWLRSSTPYIPCIHRPRMQSEGFPANRVFPTALSFNRIPRMCCATPHPPPLLGEWISITWAPPNLWCGVRERESAPVGCCLHQMWMHETVFGGGVCLKICTGFRCNRKGSVDA